MNSFADLEEINEILDLIADYYEPDEIALRNEETPE